jgi:Flp pilus assembly protein TadG
MAMPAVMLDVGRDEIKLRKQRGGEEGQTLIVVLFAMPLLIAIIALVADGSNLFTNKRSVQNAADAAVFAVAQDLPADGSACTSAPCLATFQSDADAYSRLKNSGPAVTHACADSTDTNCYVTPIPGKGNSSAQIRLRKSVTTFIAGFVGLSSSSVSAKAAVSLGGAPNAAGNVAPVGVQRDSVNCSASSCPNTPVTLDFDNQAGFALMDLSDMSTTGPTPAGSADANTMKDWITFGYPGLLPANAWYGNNNGQKNGIKNAFTADGRTVMLIPVFDTVSPATGTPLSYHVVGFAAFVIDSGGIDWNGNTHKLTGHFVVFIAKGISGGPPGGPNDFGVHVIQLDE